VNNLINETSTSLNREEDGKIGISKYLNSLFGGLAPLFVVLLCSMIVNPVYPQDSTYVVNSNGSGPSAKDAEKDALRSAVEKTVGIFLESATVIKNNQLIEDKILSFSNGFVSSYEIVKKSKENDYFTVEISAHVARQRVREQLLLSGLNVRPINGTSLFGEALTKIERQKSASSLVMSFLEKYPNDAYNIKLYPPEIIGTSSMDIGARVRIKYEITSAKDWVNKFQSYLATIALPTTNNPKSSEFSIKFADQKVEEVQKEFSLDPEVMNNIAKKMVGGTAITPAALALHVVFMNSTGDTLLIKNTLLSNIFTGAFDLKSGQKDLADIINNQPSNTSTPIAYNQYMYIIGQSPNYKDQTEEIDKFIWGGGFVFSSMRYPYVPAFFVVSDYRMTDLFLEFSCNIDVLKQVTSMKACIIEAQ
jgi:hypothetical protein